MAPSFTTLPIELQDMIIKSAIEDDLTPKRIFRGGWVPEEFKTVLPIPQGSFGSFTTDLARTSSVFHTLVVKHVNERLDKAVADFGSQEYRNYSVGQLCSKHGLLPAHSRWEEMQSRRPEPQYCGPCGILLAEIDHLCALSKGLRYDPLTWKLHEWCDVHDLDMGSKTNERT